MKRVKTYDSSSKTVSVIEITETSTTNADGSVDFQKVTRIKNYPDHREVTAPETGEKNKLKGKWKLFISTLTLLATILTILQFFSS